MSDARPRSGRSSEVPGIARHGRLKRPGPWKGLAGLVVAVVAVALVSVLGVTGITGLGLVNGIKTVNIHPGAKETIPPAPGVGVYPGGFNILIVGDDTREGQGGIGAGPDDGGALNDVTMLLHVSADHTFATAVSFPRDMIVPHPKCSKGGTSVGLPMNAALSYGGLACVVATVENFTGVTIQFAGLITFTGVISMSDAIGGVDVCTTGPLVDKYTGLDLKSAGTHNLRGWAALAFLRSRHGVGDGSDLGRISSQQVYLSSLVRKLQSAGTLSNPLTVYKIATAATQHMQLSSGLQSLDTLYSIAQTLKNIAPSRVQFVQYPGSTNGTGIYAGKVQPNTYLGNQLFDLIKADKPFTLGAQVGNRGSVVGTAPTSTAPPSTSTAAPPPGGSKPAVIDGIIGQSAAQYTCTKTRPLRNQ